MPPLTLGPIALLIAFVADLAATVALAITVGNDAPSTLGLSGVAVGLGGALAGATHPAQPEPPTKK